MTFRKKRVFFLFNFETHIIFWTQKAYIFQKLTDPKLSDRTFTKFEIKNPFEMFISNNTNQNLIITDITDVRNMCLVKVFTVRFKRQCEIVSICKLVFLERRANLCTSQSVTGVFKIIILTHSVRCSLPERRSSRVQETQICDLADLSCVIGMRESGWKTHERGPKPCEEYDVFSSVRI